MYVIVLRGHDTLDTEYICFSDPSLTTDCDLPFCRDRLERTAQTDVFESSICLQTPRVPSSRRKWSVSAWRLFPSRVCAAARAGTGRRFPHHLERAGHSTRTVRYGTCSVCLKPPTFIVMASFAAVLVGNGWVLVW